MDYESLKSEIANDPSGIGYSQYLPDAPGRLADALNAQTIDAIGKVSRSNFAGWCARSGVRNSIEDIAADKTNLLRPTALVLQDFLRGNISDYLDFGDPNVKTMLDAWQSNAALTVDQYNQLISMARTKISRAEQLGIGFVMEADLRAAGVV